MKVTFLYRNGEVAKTSDMPFNETPLQHDRVVIEGKEYPIIYRRINYDSSSVSIFLDYPIKGL